jgi:N-methylhydantoinase A
MSRYRVSMDIGGTFTDFVVVDERERRTFSGKTSSTPSNPADAVLAGLRQFVPEPAEIGFVVHGTTVGLNAFLERKGTRVLLLMTAGVSDAYSIARHDRLDLYDARYSKPERLVPRRDVFELSERLRADGSVVTPLAEESLAGIIERIRSDGIEAVAVCLLHSYVNPAHELRVREILQRECPDLSVTLSHEIAREWREYERASSATMNAYVAKKVERYLSTLEQELVQMDVAATLHVMQSNGGITTARTAREQPVQTLLSGPVGGAIGGAALARVTGRRNLICIDMGGTSFEASLIVDGVPNVSTETKLQGLPLLVPLVEIHTIGAGGGSVAWLEAGGLRVGPESAGADPGPACYGHGSTVPTVTDANLYLGRLDPSYFVDGTMSLDADAAARALASVAPQLGLGEVALAEGILAIVNAHMADAIRTITVKQGIDPRDFSLVAYGGAGPMHAAWLADELDIREVIVPWSPGTFSAWGMLQTDIRHDLAKTFYERLAGLDAGEASAVFRTLESEGRGLLLAEDVSDDDMYFARFADMRYVGQEYSVNVPVGAEITLDEIEAAFHDAHRVRYGHATPGAPVEFVHLRLAAMGRIRADAVPYRPSSNGAVAKAASRPIIFDNETHETPVVHRSTIPPGEQRQGPLVIEEPSSTTVVPPGYRIEMDETGNLVITRTANEGGAG